MSFPHKNLIRMYVRALVHIRGLHTLICRVTVTCRGRKTTAEASFSTSIQSHVIAARSFVSRSPDIRQTFDPFPRPDVLKGTYAPRRNSYRVTPRISLRVIFFWNGDRPVFTRFVCKTSLVSLSLSSFSARTERKCHDIAS